MLFSGPLLGRMVSGRAQNFCSAKKKKKKKAAVEELSIIFIIINIIPLSNFGLLLWRKPAAAESYYTWQELFLCCLFEQSVIYQWVLWVTFSDEGQMPLTVGEFLTSIQWPNQAHDTCNIMLGNALPSAATHPHLLIIDMLPVHTCMHIIICGVYLRERERVCVSHHTDFFFILV